MDLNTDIVITFSAPMDQESVELAYSSQDIPTAGISFEWNGDGTVLTIHPTADLTYDEVTTPDDIAPNYSVSITEAAQDQSGSHLAADFDWSFRTIRRVTQTLNVAPANTFVVYNDSSDTAAACPGNTSVFAGDGITVSTAILVAVDISTLPQLITSNMYVETATLSALQSQIAGTPFDDLGLLRAYHSRVNPPVATTWPSPNLGVIGVFSASAEISVRSLDVLAPFTTDWSQRSAAYPYSQYRLAFDQQTDGDGMPDRSVYACDGFSLTTRYRMP